MPLETPASTILHVMNGDATRLVFERTGVSGAVMVYADVLHEGPVPAGLSQTQMSELRATFWAGRIGKSLDEAHGHLRPWDAEFERAHEYEHVVLWFEHDLYDQLLLLRHLSAFAGQSLDRTKLSLICIGAFPGVEPFYGLGQLTPTQLGSLVGTEKAITSDQLALGRRGWSTITSPDPRGIERVLAADTSALPFLASALRRYLEEFPAVGTGLPRTEREILTILSTGATKPSDLFHAAQRREEHPFMGDSSFWFRVQHLAAAPTPLVTIDVATASTRRVLPDGLVTLTDAGHDVLAGRLDWMTIADFDRWLGGVHLQKGSIWRWDEMRQTLRAA